MIATPIIYCKKVGCICLIRSDQAMNRVKLRQGNRT